MIRQKLDEGDIALYELLTDPIWFGEFMRSTSDGEIDSSLHPALPWNYRDYQRMFLSDQTEFILYTGGRAIGKCQPAHARILTPTGYKTITELMQNRISVVYALSPDTSIRQQRAVIVPDKICECYCIKTESGHILNATANHPVLTPEGYKLIADLQEHDRIAVATRLPYESTQNMFKWHELRFLGYTLLLDKYRPEYPLTPRYKKIMKELEIIADRMLMTWHKTFEGVFTFIRKPGPYKHPIRIFLDELELYHAMRQYGARRIPVAIKSECSENLAIFIEAVYAQFAEITNTNITLSVVNEQLALDFQELLLRFGVETCIEQSHGKYNISLLDYRAYYRFWQNFTLPGVSIGKLQTPPISYDVNEYMRFEPITNKWLEQKAIQTYAIHVYEDANYISENVFVHNSVVLEDKILFNLFNNYENFPQTQESLLVTPNQAQMVPILNKIILRFTGSKLLKDFLRNRINKQEGTMQITTVHKPHIFHFRIAGSRGENNLVGLHIPKIVGDEFQLFPLNAWTQMQPTYNSWEPKRQQIYAGVPNGLRNSVLYLLDIQTPKYKKYRIPSHNNPFYTLEDDLDNIRKYGGKSDDRYVQLVLGRHGAAAFQVIPRESIAIETFPFYNYRYNSGQILKGIRFDQILQTPALPKHKTVILAIDPGFVDPTVIQVFASDDHGVWRLYVRYRLTRIDFNEQQKIIDWIATTYNAARIVIDIGAGGNGSSIMHNLMYGEEFKGKGYEQRFEGIQFKENVISGYDDTGEELTQDSKGYAANELAKLIQEKRIILSEVDHEGLSQLERVAKQRSTNGKDRYFVINSKGAGADEDDHIFASFICFVLGIRHAVSNPSLKRLAKTQGKYT